nr:hypothetical protein [Tanacetum cinerariifolium]
MDQSNPTFTKILILDTEKFKQWKFKIQQYLQNEHYALWEVIEFGDSYKAPPEKIGKGPASESSTKKKERIVVITTEDMQKRRNDVKVRTTLLLALPDEHQLRFSKYETAQELWEAILKTFGGNEATKKTKKNQLKQQYGNFKAEGSETLEQTFNRLQAIVSHLEFMDVEIEQDDLNQKFLTSLAPEWLIGKDEVHTASVPTASIQVSTVSTDVTAASLSHDTKKTGKKITIQGSDVAGFDKSKVEFFNCHKIGHFARECRAPRSQYKGKRESCKQGLTEEEMAHKALMAIDGIRWDWSYMANEEENHALVADDELNSKNRKLSFVKKIRGLERDLEVRNNKIEYLKNELEQVKKEKEGLDNKLTGFEKASKDLDNLLGSQRSDKNKEGLGYSAVPLLPAQVYSSPKKDLSWTCLPEFVDDTVTDYSRPTPSIDESKCNTSNNFSVSEHGESSGSIISKPMTKLVKAADCPTVTKTNNTENARKSTVKYVEMYRNTTKSPKVRGNQRNWNNLKSQQLGKDLLMQNKACFKCGYFDHLASDYGDETSSILRNFITEIESLKDLKVKIIRVLVNNSQNKTPYELFNSRIPVIGFLRPFGCHVMILNTLDHLGKFDAKGDEGTSSTNILGTKDAASQAMKKDVSSLRYITLPNWFHEAHIETKNSDGCNANDPKSSGISNPTATSMFPQPNKWSLPFEDIFREEADLSNMETSIPISPTSTFRIHKDHPKSQIIGPVNTPVQTRHKSKEMEEQSFIATIHQKINPELLQFWVRPIGIKWVLKNKKDERGIVIRNKARIEAIRLFLAYASFMGFIVYQMDVKSVFLYDTIDEEVYVMQPPGFQDPGFPDRVYKVEKAINYGGATQDRKSTTGWCQFLGRRLISWQWKKQTIMDTFTTEAEYVAAASGCEQVLWI